MADAECWEWGDEIDLQLSQMPTPKIWEARERHQARGDYMDLGVDWMGNSERAIKDDAQVGIQGDLGHP